jgi:hypothetical protein
MKKLYYSGLYSHAINNETNDKASRKTPFNWYANIEQIIQVSKIPETLLIVLTIKPKKQNKTTSDETKVIDGLSNLQQKNMFAYS